MDHLTSLEAGLAEKLQQLPVPDMAGSIWYQIERELDNSLPEDETDQDPGNNSPPPGGTGNELALFGSWMVIITLVLFAYLARKEGTREKTKAIPENRVSRPVLNGTEPTIRKASKDNGVSARKSGYPVKSRTDSVLPVFMTPLAPIKDAAVLTLSEKDTVAISLKPQAGVPVSLPPDTPLRRMPRGVKGLKPDDYKIVSERDSASDRN